MSICEFPISQAIGPNDEIKYLTPEYLRSSGLLQEVNRQFFHPIGLALDLVYDEETETYRLGGVQDWRDNEEGCIFEANPFSSYEYNGWERWKVMSDKRDNVLENQKRRHLIREFMLGYVQQAW